MVVMRNTENTSEMATMIMIDIRGLDFGVVSGHTEMLAKQMGLRPPRACSPSPRCDSFAQQCPLLLVVCRITHNFKFMHCNSRCPPAHFPLFLFHSANALLFYFAAEGQPSREAFFPLATPWFFSHYLFSWIAFKLCTKYITNM
jgi:hypothetical protein